MTETGEALRTDHPGVIAPPPLIFGGILLVALAFDWLVSGPGFGLPYVGRMAAGGILSIGGLALILVSGAQFRIAKTHIEPWKPSTALIITGIYHYSRNPIYLGMALIYVGLSLLADSVLTLAWLPLALIIIYHGVIRREERYLQAKFGETYRTYLRQVRRWI